MSLPEIRFEEIRLYDGSRHTGFEELCSQLASLEPAPQNASFFRKGRGADAGVECFLRLPDESEIGWQAKYLFSWDDSLAAQLDKSVRTALTKHSKLVRYIVCLPFDPSDSRPAQGRSALQKWEAWKAKWEKIAKAEERNLAIVLWSKSELSRRLSTDNPAYGGRLLYWFGQEALTGPWFHEQFEKARAALGSRYTPETNVELPIRRDFLGFVRDPSLQAEIDDWFLRIKEEGHATVRSVRDAAGKDVAEPHSASLQKAVDAIAALMDGGPIGPERPYPIATWCDAVSECLKLARDALSWTYKLPQGVVSSAGTTPERWAQSNLLKLLDVLNTIFEQLRSDHWQLANAKALLLHGPAGIGKSHLFADVIEHQVQEGRPALLILSSVLIDGEPWRQIMTQFDLPPTQQVKHFLGALDAAGQAAGTRAIICVDAINERHGIDIWPVRLAAFLKTADPFPRVCIALSCRSTYMPYVIQDSIGETELKRVEHHGFSTDGGKAAKVYLDKRGIIRPGAPNLVPEFENPLFLKTCCDFLEKEGKKELPRGLRGVTSIFSFYNQAVTRALNKRMNLDPRMEIIPRAISGFAELLAKAGESYLPTFDAIKFFDSIYASGGSLTQSLLAQLENEGLLAVEPVRCEDESIIEMVRFTFERFGDHAIASRVLSVHLDTRDPKRSFAQGRPLHEFIFGKEAYRRAGIIEAIAVQLPERTGVEILDANPTEDSSCTVNEAFFASLLWREQSHFTDRTFELVRRFKHGAEVNNLLISISTEPANKFNARFFHEDLMKPTMPERDAVWSTYVAQHGDDEGNPIEILISWALQNGMEQIEDERAELATLMLGWFLTTSNRAVRDKTTKALTCLFANRLTLAARVLGEFAPVDDPYVLERLLAAIYGATLQGTATTGLGELAEAVFSLVFKSGRPPTNILLRDHAFGLIQYVEWRGKLPASVDMESTRPPYRSSWPLDPVPDELIESYKQDYGEGRIFTDAIVSSAVNDGDFARYVIDHIVDKFSPAPIGSVTFPNRFEVCQAWLKEFDESATPVQQEALKKVTLAAKAVRGQPTYSKTPEREALDAAQNAFRETIPAVAWEYFRVRAQNFIVYAMFGGRHYDKRPATFDNKWARRWVCKRAHELGWTAQRFGGFDRQRGHGRHDHHVERIGKKYQWLALHELAARMADNLAFVGRSSYADDEKAGTYESARQIGLRDIDPSLLATQTNYDGWGEWGRTWWVPYNSVLRAIDPVERLAWLESTRDIVNDASLIDVRNPKTGRRWLALRGFADWRQLGIDDVRKELQRDTWFRLNCVVVRKRDEAMLVKSLKGRMLIDPHALPKIELRGDHYLGEYPWHSSVSDLGDWTEKDGWHQLSVPTRATVADYLCERGGYDYSIDKTISVELPAPWLATAMGLRLSDGKRLTYVGAKGEVLFYDPSVDERGPQSALVDRDAFLAMLDRKGLSAVWIIAGEKGVFGGSDSGMGFGGRLLHTAIYRMKDGDFTRQFFSEREVPSSEQLRMFLGGRKLASRVRARQPRK